MSGAKSIDGFVRRAALAVGLAWLILGVHALAQWPVSQMIERLPAVFAVGGLCAIIGGGVAAAFVRGRPMVLAVVAVLLSAGVMGVLTRVF